MIIKVERDFALIITSVLATPVVSCVLYLVDTVIYFPILNIEIMKIRA